MNVAILFDVEQAKRLGSDEPSKNVKTPELTYPLEAFQKSPEIDAIQIICQTDQRDYIIGVIRDYRINKIRWITDRGSSLPSPTGSGS